MRRQATATALRGSGWFIIYTFALLLGISFTACAWKYSSRMPYFEEDEEDGGRREEGGGRPVKIVEGTRNDNL